MVDVFAWILLAFVVAMVGAGEGYQGLLKTTLGMAVVLCVPSEATTETVSPTVPVPLADVLVTLTEIIGVVTLPSASRRTLTLPCPPQSIRATAEPSSPE